MSLYMFLSFALMLVVFIVCLFDFSIANIVKNYQNNKKKWHNYQKTSRNRILPVYKWTSLAHWVGLANESLRISVYPLVFSVRFIISIRLFHWDYLSLFKLCRSISLLSLVNFLLHRALLQVIPAPYTSCFK